MREQAERLELGELGADGRRRDARGRRARRASSSPTGMPVATNSSTTRRRIACCRSRQLQRFRHLQEILAARPSDRSGEQLGRHAAAEEAAALGQRERLAVRRPRDRALATRARPAGSSAGRRPASGSGSSRRSPSITRSRAAYSSSSGSISRRAPSDASACEVAPELRRVPPAPVLDCVTAPIPSPR